MQKNPKLSIVIPVYNEEDTIEKVIKEVDQLKIDKEIIAVNDGSRDKSAEILDKIARRCKRLKVVHKKNGGKGSALKEGFLHVTGDYTVVQDADLEYNPEDLVTMFNYALKNDVDVVYGNRFSKRRFIEGMDWKNFLGNNLILPILASILYGQIIHDEATCYKMFRTSLLKSIKLNCTRFEFCPEVTAKVRKRGFTIHEIPINYYPRSLKGGKKLHALKDGLEAVWTLLKYRFTD